MMRRLRTAALLLILSVGFATISAPLLFSQSQPSAANPSPAFEVVSIRQNKTEGGWRLQTTPDGYTALRVTLNLLVQEAYGLKDYSLLSGGPVWASSAKFDIEAKFDPSTTVGLTHVERAAMLQPLLADRFQLKVHHEAKDFPAYALVLAKSDLKFHETKPEDLFHNSDGEVRCHILRGGPNLLEVQGCTIADFATVAGMLKHITGRTVVDKTGLSARYTLSLHWTPEDAPPQDASGSSIFTAIQEQLGLKFEPARVQLDTLVIDHAEMPSEN